MKRYIRSYNEVSNGPEPFTHDEIRSWFRQQFGRLIPEGLVVDDGDDVLGYNYFYGRPYDFDRKEEGYNYQYRFYFAIRVDPSGIFSILYRKINLILPCSLKCTIKFSDNMHICAYSLYGRVKDSEGHDVYTLDEEYGTSMNEYFDFTEDYGTKLTDLKFNKSDVKRYFDAIYDSAAEYVNILEKESNKKQRKTRNTTRSNSVPRDIVKDAVNNVITQVERYSNGQVEFRAKNIKKDSMTDDEASYSFKLISDDGVVIDTNVYFIRTDDEYEPWVDYSEVYDVSDGMAAIWEEYLTKSGREFDFDDEF